MTRPMLHRPNLAGRSRAGRRAAALSAAAIAVALTFGLTACGNTGEQTAAALHASVVQIAESAAGGDYAAALAGLALLDRDVAAAADAGTIDAEREEHIRAAMELVRADLEAAEVAASPEPEPEPAPADDGGDGGDGGDDGGNDEPGNNGNNGNGNGKSKSNGKSKGDD